MQAHTSFILMLIVPELVAFMLNHCLINLQSLFYFELHCFESLKSDYMVSFNTDKNEIVTFLLLCFDVELNNLLFVTGPYMQYFLDVV